MDTNRIVGRALRGWLGLFLLWSLMSLLAGCHRTHIRNAEDWSAFCRSIPALQVGSECVDGDSLEAVFCRVDEVFCSIDPERVPLLYESLIGAIVSADSADEQLTDLCWAYAWLNGAWLAHITRGDGRFDGGERSRMVRMSDEASPTLAPRIASRLGYEEFERIIMGYAAFLAPEIFVEGLTSAAQTTLDEEEQELQLEGTLNGNVAATLLLHDGLGCFSYMQGGKWVKISLALSHLRAEGKGLFWLVLSLQDAEGNMVGELQGRWNGYRYGGTYTDAQGKNLPFQLQQAFGE